MKLERLGLETKGQPVSGRNVAGLDQGQEPERAGAMRRVIEDGAWRIAYGNT